jgi:hypothetical protein
MYKRKFYRQKHNRLDLEPTTVITPEAMTEYGYGGASRDKLEGSFPVVRKRIEDFFEKLEKQGVGTAACVHTATFGGSEGEGKEIDFFDDEDRLEKARVYLQPGEKPPKDIQVMRGPRGGLYYESEQGAKPLEDSLSDKIAQKAARLEPKFSSIITNIKEATGGVLYKFEFRQKDQKDIDRKIKEIKESHPELSEEESAEQVTDYLRYTIVYSCEEYGKKVLTAQNKLKEMGFDFYDKKVRKYFSDGPYRGYNTVMQDSEGNVFELQFHTHKSLEKLGKVRPLYEQFRVERDNHKRGQLYLQMMREWEDFVLPSDIEVLTGVAM